MQAIRVLIVECHPKVRLALAARLRAAEGIEVVAVTVDPNTGLKAAAEFEPHVVLIDSKSAQAGPGGLRETLIALAEFSSHIIVLTTYSDEAEKKAVLGAGAERYLLKDVQSDLLISSIFDTSADLSTRSYPRSSSKFV